MPLFVPRRSTRPALPAGERVYAIGDVHGRLDLLTDLLARIRADAAGRAAARTQIVLLGDLVDRGPDSAGVVRLAMAPLGWAATVALMGNHEAVMLAAIGGDPAMRRLWLRIGGIEAARSWGVADRLLEEGTPDEIVAAADRAIAPAERTWLAASRPSYRLGGYLFAHAGVRPGVPIDEQRNEDMLWIRDRFLKSRRAHGAMVVHGHSIVEAVAERRNRIGIDTGAFARGRLTAVGLEGEDRWFLAATGASGRDSSAP